MHPCFEDSVDPPRVLHLVVEPLDVILVERKFVHQGLMRLVLAIFQRGEYKESRLLQ